jgi:hypothetical protein
MKEWMQNSTNSSSLHNMKMRSYVSTASLLEKDRLVHFGEEIE